MSKSTLLRVGDTWRSSELPPRSRVVLDFLGERFSPERVQAWKEGGFTVQAILARAPTLGDPVLATFVDQGDPTVLVPAESPSVSEALSVLPLLKRMHFTVELPLRDERDLNVFKVLSSLGVKLSVPFADLATASDTIRDAMHDAMLRPGRRAPVTPFAEMQALFLEEGFELSRLDFRDNDHFVDLRSPDERRPRSAWDDVRVDQKRVPFLLDTKPCAYCEGLLFCHGYLAPPDGDLERCRTMLSEFIELHNLTQIPRGSGNGPTTQPTQPPRSSERTH